MLTVLLAAASMALTTDTCPQVTRIRATPYLSDSAKVEWHPGRGATQHLIRLRAVGAPSWQTITTSDSAFTRGGFTSGTRYEIQINTVCGTSISGYTASTTFTMPVTTAIRPSVATLDRVTVYDMNFRLLATYELCECLQECYPTTPGMYIFRVASSSGAYTVRQVCP